MEVRDRSEGVKWFINQREKIDVDLWRIEKYIINV